MVAILALMWAYSPLNRNIHLDNNSPIFNTQTQFISRYEIGRVQDVFRDC